MPMRPLLLKGHQGPVSKILYNREGDLIFTAARKDKLPCVWYADNGERIGNYEGHEGAVVDLDVDFSSTRLLTASADRKAILWDVESGKDLFHFEHKSSVKCVGFAEGATMALTVQENNFGELATIFIYNLESDIRKQTGEAIRVMIPEGTNAKINNALWGPLNTHIISASSDGTIRKWNVELGKEEVKVDGHRKAIKDCQFSKDRTMFITASTDKECKLWDTKTLECLKTFKSDRPLNACSMSPIFNHVIVGGGEDAMTVTQTSSKVGHFEVDFFHMVYMDYMGSVKGHFGPVNTLAFNPDGKSYSSGSEDGYVRVHHFDKEYFNNKHSMY